MGRRGRVRNRAHYVDFVFPTVFPKKVKVKLSKVASIRPYVGIVFPTVLHFLFFKLEAWHLC